MFDKEQCLINNEPQEIDGKGIGDKSTGLYHYIMNDPLFPICVVQSKWANCGIEGWTTSNNIACVPWPPKRAAVRVSLTSGIPPLSDSCLEGKQARNQNPKTATRRSKHPLQLIHSDLCGSLFPPSLGEAQYFVTLTDNFSQYTWIYFLRCKSDTLTSFKIFKSQAELALH